MQTLQQVKLWAMAAQKSAGSDGAWAEKALLEGLPQLLDSVELAQAQPAGSRFGDALATAQEAHHTLMGLCLLLRWVGHEHLRSWLVISCAPLAVDIQ